MSTIKVTFALGFAVLVFVVASAVVNPAPDAIQHARVQNQIERMELLQTVGNVAIVGGTAILLIALAIGLRFLWAWSGRPLTLYARDGLFPAVVIDLSTPLDRLTGQRRILAHDPNRSGGATLSIHAARDGQITAHGAQVESSDQAAIIKSALNVQKVQAGYRRGPTVAEIKGELGYYDRTPRPAIITEQPKALPAPVQPLLTLSEAIRQAGSAGDIPLGQQPDGERKLAIWRPRQSYHMSILGSSGNGKTSSVGYTIAICAIHQGWRVVILDPEEEQQWRLLSPWAEWTHADEDSVTGHILAVHTEYERRGEFMTANRYAAYSEIPSYHNQRRVLMIVEEYGDLRSKAEKAGTLAEFDDALAQLARRGGKRGFHLLLLDQHYKATDSAPAWPETVARNVHRLSFHQAARDSSLVGVNEMPDLEPGQFGYRSARYEAWEARSQVDRLLANVPRLSGPRILDNAPVIDGSFVRSAALAATPTGVIGAENAPNERTNERPILTGDEARQAIHAHLTANPKATQAEIRDALKTSKGWTHQCWHEWHAIQKTRPQPPTPANVWDVMGREVIDLTDEAGADAIRRIDWRKVEIK